MEERSEKCFVNILASNANESQELLLNKFTNEMVVNIYVFGSLW